MSSYKCHNCGLINALIDGDQCKRCNTAYDPNASPYRSTYTPQQPSQQVQQYQQPAYQQPMYQQHFQGNPTPISGAEALLWALCCFPIGYGRFNQLGKFFLWLLIVIVTGGIGAIPMYIDYAMCYGAQKNRPLKPWEFFPQQ